MVWTPTCDPSSSTIHPIVVLDKDYLDNAAGRRRGCGGVGARVDPGGALERDGSLPWPSPGLFMLVAPVAAVWVDGVFAKYFAGATLDHGDAVGVDKDGHFHRTAHRV